MEIFEERQARSQLEWLQGLLEQAKMKRFFGKITVTFQNGMIEKVDNLQSLKPPRESRD